MHTLLCEHWNSNRLSSFITISKFRKPLKAEYWLKNLAKLGMRNSLIIWLSSDRFSLKYFSRILKYNVISLFKSNFFSFVILSLTGSSIIHGFKNSYFFLYFLYFSAFSLSVLTRSIYFCFILNSFSS